jgi:hypothetical protein
MVVLVRTRNSDAEMEATELWSSVSTSTFRQRRNLACLVAESATGGQAVACAEVRQHRLQGPPPRATRPRAPADDNALNVSSERQAGGAGGGREEQGGLLKGQNIVVHDKHEVGLADEAVPRRGLDVAHKIVRLRHRPVRRVGRPQRVPPPEHVPAVCQ